MSNVDIYTILASKPHNKHYLKRYYNFILACSQANSLKTKEELGYTNKHHIAPMAKDLFPEYRHFRENRWNKAILTGRQHFIAHWMLWKAYGGSQTYAFSLMHIKLSTKTSKWYSLLREEHSKNSSALNKGKAIFKDINGENIKCDVTDPRVISGELISIHKGKIMTEDTKKKMSVTHTGMKMSEESKRKISIASSNKSLESKRKMSEWQYDRTIYKFINLHTNECFIGCRFELEKDKNIVLKPLSLKKNPSKSVKGWKIILECMT